MPAATEPEAREKFEGKVTYWENEPKEAGKAITVILSCNRPEKHILEQKTLRG
jgi:hypothetical protein